MLKYYTQVLSNISYSKVLWFIIINIKNNYEEYLTCLFEVFVHVQTLLKLVKVDRR